ncbi:MAG: hypothetical protein HC809_08095 [Gammaproteobacteria bacterium]|nr:hypothetical protein [Gammaproteobacteria bacterium]
MSEFEIEGQVYRKRLDDALAGSPTEVPLAAIAKRVRRETSVKDLMSFGFSHLVMTLLVFLSRTYRMTPSRSTRASGDVESAPQPDSAKPNLNKPN